MSKPILEVTSAAAGTKVTLDFDTVQMVTEGEFRVSGTTTIRKVTVLRFRTGQEMSVLEDYRTISDMWIKLAHEDCASCRGRRL